MKEPQFKTGGRRLRIEDLQALQDSIEASCQFLAEANENFVISGCTVRVGDAYRLPTNTGQLWGRITLNVSDGYVFIDGKIRKVKGGSFDVQTSYQRIYIVKEDKTTGSDITYFDGSVGQQFHNYTAKIEFTDGRPSSSYIVEP